MELTAEKIVFQNLLLLLYGKREFVTRIVSHRKLREFYEAYGREDSRVALERWHAVAEKAEWKNFSEIKVDFRQRIMLAISIMFSISKETIIGSWLLLSLR